MKPNPNQRYSATYIRELIARANHTQASAGAAIGVAARTMRRYVSLDKSVYREPPYAVVYALENLPKRRA